MRKLNMASGQRVAYAITALWLATLCFWPNPSAAYFWNRDPLCDPGFLVGFFNGANSTPLEADLSADRLSSIIGTTWKDQPIDYHVFYNSSAKESSIAKALPNFLEAIDQYNTEVSGSTSAKIKLFWQTLTGSRDKDIPSEGASAWETFKDAVLAVRDATARAIAAGVAAAIPDGGQPTEADLANMISDVDKAIKTSRKLLFIAHSQGNFFMNGVYDYVQNKQGSQWSVQAIHIGTPTSTLRGPYTTVNIDKVINAFRAAMGNNAMPANVDLPESHWATDGTGHSLALTYLDSGLAAYAQITGNIRTALDRLQDPPLPKGYDRFSAQLRFGSQLPFVGIEASPERTMHEDLYYQWSSWASGAAEELQYINSGGWIFLGGSKDQDYSMAHVWRNTDRWCGAKTVRNWDLQSSDDHNYLNNGFPYIDNYQAPQKFPSLFRDNYYYKQNPGEDINQAVRKIIQASGTTGAYEIKQVIASIPPRIYGYNINLLQCNVDAEPFDGYCSDNGGATVLIGRVPFYVQTVTVAFTTKRASEN
jgi:hypothetical protein